MTELYVDVLLVINYVINSLLLSCLSRCAGRRPKGSRLVAAALVGALGSLLIFLPSRPFFLSMAERLLLSALMVRILLRWRGWKVFLQEWLLFFAINFFFAGAMLALWLIIRPAGMLFYNGVVYFNIPAMLLVILSAAAYLALGLFWRFSRGGRIAQEIYEMAIHLGRRSVTVDALVDTGNSLYEPFSGSPVAVCRLEEVANLLGSDCCEALARRDFSRCHGQLPNFRFVGYQTVGGGGMLPAFRADRICLKKDSRRAVVEDVYIAVTTERIGQNGCHAILNPDLVVHNV